MPEHIFFDERAALFKNQFSLVRRAVPTIEPFAICPMGESNMSERRYSAMDLRRGA